MMLPLLFALAVIILGTDGRRVRPDPFFRNDYTYHRKAHGWLKLHRMPAKWHDARLRCYAEGGALASPMSNNLLLGMWSVINQIRLKIGNRWRQPSLVKDMENPKPLKIFTGIADAFESGEFRSIEGLPLSKVVVPWAPLEPDNRDARERCIAMYLNPNLTIADVDCDSPLPYICYKKKTKKLHFSHECGTVDPDYVYDTRTKHCYKYHRNGQPWPTAYMICSAEGGYLAIINSDVEVQIMKELMDKNPKDTVFAKYWDNFAVGVHAWSKNGIWVTIHGEPLKDTGYVNWQINKPINLDPGQYCVNIKPPNAEFNDLWCNRTVPFICEKEPDSLTQFDDDTDINERDNDMPHPA